MSLSFLRDLIYDLSPRDLGQDLPLSAEPVARAGRDCQGLKELRLSGHIMGIRK